MSLEEPALIVGYLADDGHDTGSKKETTPTTIITKISN
jgi:hypothetical protein